MDSPKPCLKCLINELSEVFSRVSDSTKYAYDFYTKGEEIETIDGNAAIKILIGKLYRSAVYLNSSMLKPNFDYEAFCAVARNLIEKIALLNHIIDKPTRSSKIAEIYKTSSLDIESIITAKPTEYSKLITDWISDNSWSRSTISSRIEKLANKDVEVIYAYLSRLNHGLNRDEMLKRHSDEYYISACIYIILMRAIDHVLIKLPSDIYTRSIAHHHIKNTEISESDFALYDGTLVILILTGFTEDLDILTEEDQVELRRYNESMDEEILKDGANFLIYEHDQHK